MCKRIGEKTDHLQIQQQRQVAIITESKMFCVFMMFCVRWIMTESMHTLLQCWQRKPTSLSLCLMWTMEGQCQKLFQISNLTKLPFLDFLFFIFGSSLYGRKVFSSSSNQNPCQRRNVVNFVHQGREVGPLYISGLVKVWWFWSQIEREEDFQQEIERFSSQSSLIVPQGLKRYPCVQCKLCG